MEFDKGITLVLDSALPTAVVGLVRGGKVLAEGTIDEARAHGEKMPALLDEVFAKARKNFCDVERIVVGVGPGSFVGVRVAMSMAKGISLALNKPLYGVCSLLAMAGEAGGHEGEGCTLVDARRDEIYFRAWCREKKGPHMITKPLGDPRVLSPQCVAEEAPEKSFVVGNGVRLSLASFRGEKIREKTTAIGLWEAFRARMEEQSAPLADEMVNLVPHYVRAPDARRPSPGFSGGLKDGAIPPPADPKG